MPGLEDGAVALAFGWVLVGGALREVVEDASGLGELPKALVDLVEVFIDELCDVSARRLPVVGYRQDLSDLGECQSRGLGVTDEAQPV